MSREDGNKFVFVFALGGRDDINIAVETFFLRSDRLDWHHAAMQKCAPAVYFMLLLGVNADVPGNWTGDYAPCERHDELLKNNSMEVGVRFSTSDRRVAVEFARALDFWASILDMTWHTENSSKCAIQIVDGYPGLFQPAQIARAQFPGAQSFQGWIAFNPGASLSGNDLFLTAVHEIGHALGLRHSSNAFSVMYFLRTDDEVVLDVTDLAALERRHKLRLAELPSTSPITIAPKKPGSGTANRGLIRNQAQWSKR